MSQIEQFITDIFSFTKKFLSTYKNILFSPKILLDDLKKGENEKYIDHRIFLTLCLFVYILFNFYSFYPADIYMKNGNFFDEFSKNLGIAIGNFNRLSSVDKVIYTFPFAVTVYSFIYLICWSAFRKFDKLNLLIKFITFISAGFLISRNFLTFLIIIIKNIFNLSNYGLINIITFALTVILALIAVISSEQALGKNFFPPKSAFKKMFVTTLSGLFFLSFINIIFLLETNILKDNRSFVISDSKGWNNYHYKLNQTIDCSYIIDWEILVTNSSNNTFYITDTTSILLMDKEYQHFNVSVKNKFENLLIKFPPKDVVFLQLQTKIDEKTFENIKKQEFTLSFTQVFNHVEEQRGLITIARSFKINFDDRETFNVIYIEE